MESNISHLKIADLIARQLRKELSDEEAAVLNEWRSAHEDNENLYQYLTDPAHLQEAINNWPGEPDEAAWQSLAAKLSGERERGHFIRSILPYAAMLGACIIGGTLMLLHKTQKPAEIAQKKEIPTLTPTDIRPLGKVAKLILGDGRVLKLDSSGHALSKAGMALQHNGGELVYAADGTKGPAVFNTIVTPRGGEYELVLPDGSKVWLNNASSLRFPTHFAGVQRQVYLTGEAYFEIADDARHPFIVTTFKSDIRVLGTHFNVRSYIDERYESTTLTSGLVQVVKNTVNPEKPVLLKPGFEAVITDKDAPVKIDKADLESALAWKEGMFVFDGATLEDIMLRVARWYDVSIVYHLPAAQPLHFTGRIRKYENIGGLLHLLELTRRVRFTVSGRVVHVYPFVQA